MWKLIAGTFALLAVILALTKLQSAHPGLDPRDQLAFEKQVELQRPQARAAHTLTELDCAATHASRATVRTFYLVHVNNRPDLSNADDRDAASADLAQAIVACGAKPQTVEDQAHQSGVDLEVAAATSMLKAGR